MTNQSNQAREPIVTLLVEDNPVQAEMIQAMLTQGLVYDYRVVVAPTVGEAIIALRNNRWQLIILDLVLPNGQGIDVLKRVRAVAPSLPLVVVTVLKAEEFERQAIENYADEYIVKWEECRDPDVFCRKIRKVIWRKEAQQQAAEMFEPIRESQSKMEDFIKRGEEDPGVAPFPPTNNQEAAATK